MSKPKSGISKKSAASNRRANRAVRQQFKNMLIQILLYIRTVFDCVVDWLFGYFNNAHKRVVPPTSDSILGESATRLAEQIRTGECTSEKIVRAFVARIQEVNPLINAVVDERFADAIKEAEIIDQDIAAGRISTADFTRKPFLGVPFTTKDSTSCKGMLQTLGLLARRNTRATEDAEVIVLMKNAGGILLATSNIPEVNMWQETRNNLIGQTRNPYDTTRTTGGSSGGEASLLASSGSPMGIGTDIGGSVRMPAFYCGIWAHKPTSDVVPTKGLTFRTGLEKNSMVVAGPMSRFAGDLSPMLKVLAGNQSNNLRLDEPVNLQNINFFYMEESNDPRMSSVSNEMKGAMQKVVQHFTTLLHQSENAPKKADLPDMKYSSQFWRHEITKEPLDFPKELANRQGSVNVWMEFPKKCMGMSDYTLAALINIMNSKLPAEKMPWTEETLTKLRREILALLGTNGVLLYPSYPSTAPYHYVPFFRPFNFGFWAVFNALRLPVTQVPLGLGKDGLPLGIQVVTAPFNDRLSIAVGKELEHAFGGWVSFTR